MKLHSCGSMQKTSRKPPSVTHLPGPMQGALDQLESHAHGAWRLSGAAVQACIHNMRTLALREQVGPTRFQPQRFYVRDQLSQFWAHAHK